MTGLYDDITMRNVMSLGGTKEVAPTPFEGFIRGTGSLTMKALATAGRSASMGFATLPILADAITGGTTMQDRYFKDVQEDVFQSAVDRWSMKPNEVGIAAEIAGGVLGTGLMILASPAGAVVNQFTSSAEDLIRENPDVSLGKALGVGAVQAAGLTAGIIAPPALGYNLWSKIAAGAGINWLQGVVTRGASGAVVEGTSAEPKFQALGLKDQSIDLFTGAVFGAAAQVMPSWRLESDRVTDAALSWRAKRQINEQLGAAKGTDAQAAADLLNKQFSEQRQAAISSWQESLTPTQKAAVAAARVEHHLTVDSMPGRPTNPNSGNANRDRLLEAIDSLLKDKPLPPEGRTAAAPDVRPVPEIPTLRDLSDTALRPVGDVLPITQSMVPPRDWEIMTRLGLVQEGKVGDQTLQFVEPQALAAERAARADDDQAQPINDRIARVENQIQDAETVLEAARYSEPDKVGEIETKLDMLNERLATLKEERPDFEVDPERAVQAEQTTQAMRDGNAEMRDPDMPEQVEVLEPTQQRLEREIGQAIEGNTNYKPGEHAIAARLAADMVNRVAQTLGKVAGLDADVIASRLRFARAGAPSGEALTQPRRTPADLIERYRPRVETSQYGGRVYANDYMELGNSEAIGSGKGVKGDRRVFRIMDKQTGAAADVGFVIVEIDKNGKFAALRNIEIRKDYRGNGAGERVVATMLAHNGPGYKMDIVDITHAGGDGIGSDTDALPFWKKNGTQLVNYSRDPNVQMDGMLSLEDYLGARRGRGTEEGNRGAAAEDLSADRGGAGAAAGGMRRGRPSAEDRAELARLNGDSLFQGPRPKPGPDSPGRGVEEGNKLGFWPDLRVKVTGRLKLPEKPLFTQATTNANAAKQLAAIDGVLAKFPKATDSLEEWTKMQAYAFASGEVPVPPYAFIRDLNGEGAAAKLRLLTPGQIADADHGFENAAEFRRAYTSGELDVTTTGKLFLWSMLSRGVSPYAQESLFIDAFNGADPWIRKAAAGQFTEADYPAYLEWSQTAAPKGSGQPGAGASHNLNAFGRDFLVKMSKVGADGKSHLQRLHDMMADPNQTGTAIRREFATFGEGVGIDNKVVSFTMLVAGFDDVMVLDRVQIRQLYDDGRFNGTNLYDGVVGENGQKITGSSLNDLMSGARGILVYEAIERGLKAKIKDIYAAVGRPQDASIGRYHWETWVADSQQEASHGTLGAILHDAKGDDQAIAKVSAKQGAYGAYEYGARYNRDEAGNPWFGYEVPGAGSYEFSVPAFRAFLEDIKKASTGVVPTRFKVSESGNGPWYERQEVNLQRLAERAAYWADRAGGTGEGKRALEEAARNESAADSAGSTGRLNQDSPWYYSALGRAIDNSPTKAADANGWKQWLKGLVNKGLVKADEIKATELEEYLDATQGKITKEQLQTFMQEGGVRVEEVELGGAGKRGFEELKAEFQRQGFDIERDPGWEEGGVEYRDIEGNPLEFDELPPDLQRLVNENSEQGDVPAEATRFANFQLPGAKEGSYREIALVLPRRAAPGHATGKVEFDPMDEEYPWVIMVNGREVNRSRQGGQIADDILAEMLDRENEFKTPSNNYRVPQGHSMGDKADTNRIAHIRFNERTGPNGERVLFIEEIQSDWAQQGKKQGFAGKEPELKPGYRIWQMENGKWRIDKDDLQNGAWTIKDTREEALKSALSMGAATQSDLPSGPFVGKTEAWVALSMKRMIRYAAENGFDQIAWTTGAQQADRYSLAKQVDSIDWKPYANNTTLVDIKMPNQNPLQLQVGKDGKVTDARGPGFDTFRGKPLDEIIGKAAADHILGSAEGNLSGEGLKIGGEGMKGFYDKIVPTVAKDVMKKLGGGKVDVVNLKTPDEMTPLEKLQEARDASGMTMNEWMRMTSQEQKAATEEYWRNKPVETMAQQGLTITPEMRAKVMEGQALFQSASPYGLEAFGIKSLDEISPAYRTPEAWREVPAAMRNVDTARALRQSVIDFEQGLNREFGWTEGIQHVWINLDANGNLSIDRAANLTPEQRLAVVEGAKAYADANDLGLTVRRSAARDLGDDLLRNAGLKNWISIQRTATGVTPPPNQVMWVRDPRGAALFQRPVNKKAEARGFLDIAADRKLTIGLLDNSDPSTLIHEPAHAFLEILNDLAKTTPELEGWMKIFFDDNGITRQQWDSWGINEKRVYHERFARGFESYVMSGKAPTEELRTLFQRFRDWLIAIYKSATSLNVKVSKEMEGLYAKLLGSEQADPSATAQAPRATDLEPPPPPLSRGEEGAPAAGGMFDDLVEEKPAYADKTIDDPDMREVLRTMAESEAGWAQIGGRNLTGETGVFNRSTWIPKAEWWLDRPDNIKKLKEAEYYSIVDKALMGEPLKPIEQRAIDFMLAKANERLKFDQEHGTAEVDALTSELQGADLEPSLKNLRAVDAVAIAHQIDPAKVERLAMEFQDDDAGFVAGIERMIDDHKNSQAATSRTENQPAPAKPAADTNGARSAADPLALEADRVAAELGDQPMEITMPDGTTQTMTAAQYLAEIRDAAGMAREDIALIQEAAQCLLGAI